MGEELEIETRALVTKEIQLVDENEKPLYSDEDKENLVQLANTVLKPKLVSAFNSLEIQLLRFILLLKRLSLNTRQLSKEYFGLLVSDHLCLITRVW